MSETRRSEHPLRVLVVGAHPDDCDLNAGGVACKYADRGDEVLFVSVTDGSAGHQSEAGVALARRREREAEAAAEVAGIEFRMLDNRDGHLRPTLERRKTIIRLVREFDPDLLLTHRPNDYHPDHRYTSQLVQDAAYTVTVPNVCPETPALDTDPVIAYLCDSFRKPNPFDPDAVVAIDGVVDRKFEMLDCHKSQVYEWLPYNQGLLDAVPDEPAARREWLESADLSFVSEFAAVADRFRDRLVERYGSNAGAEVCYAEAFEMCEYGRPVEDDELPTLFPFVLE